jgi:glycosyltransferase involved in cell wall biosynthesis
MNRVFVHDPTSTDSSSQVRGVGRYLSIMRQALPEWFDSLPQSPDIFIHPFFNPINQPRLNQPNYHAKRAIAIIHDVIPLQFPEYFPLGITGGFIKRRNRRLLSQAYDLLVTDSQTSKHAIVQYLNPQIPCEVVYPASRLEAAPSFNSALQVPSTYFIYVGDVNWHKNIALIAQAAHEAALTTIFVGNAFMKDPLTHPWHIEYAKYKAIQRTSPYVVEVGYVSDNELAWLYQHAVANILVSREEGFGYSFVEAARFATPSILSNIPIFHEISQGRGCIMVPEGDLFGLVCAMKRLVKEESCRFRLGFEAQERSKHFRVEDFRNAWLSVVGQFAP